jgi:hypothetical protein
VTQRVVREMDGGMGHSRLCKWTQIDDWKASEQGEHSRIHTEVVWMGHNSLQITNVITSSEAGAHNLIKSGYLSDLGNQQE